jgi:hypothetical protein
MLTGTKPRLGGGKLAHALAVGHGRLLGLHLLLKVQPLFDKH